MKTNWQMKLTRVLQKKKIMRLMKNHYRKIKMFFRNITMQNKTAEISAIQKLSTGNYRWTICALIFFATTINYLDRAVISLLKSYLEKDFKFPLRLDLFLYSFSILANCPAIRRCISSGVSSRKILSLLFIAYLFIHVDAASSSPLK